MTTLQTELFHIIPDAQVILNMKGTFFQRKVYRRGTRLWCNRGECRRPDVLPKRRRRVSQ